MIVLPAVVLGVFGSLIGSFLNVVIFRVPAKRSIVSPPSACGSCGHAIRWYDNIPIISWLVLRGKCRDCGAKISVRYPLVEAGGAIFFVVVALWFVPPILAAGTTQDIVAQLLVLVAFLYLASISLALALIDLDTHTLPNVIVLPAYGVGAVLLGAAGILSANWTGLLDAAIGAVALFLIYFIAWFISPKGMGFGDVKLAGVLGLFLGYVGLGPLFVGALAAFLLGGLFGVALLISRRATRKTGVPFGPWMLGGAWLGILAGQAVASWYLHLFGLGGS